MDILHVLKEQISLRQATGMIQTRVFTESLPQLVFYPDDVSTDRKEWSRIFLADNLDPKAPRIVMAQSGRLITGSEGARLQIHLEKGTIYEFDAEDPSKDNVSVFATTDIPLEVEEAARKIEVIAPKPDRMRTGDLWGARGDTSEERLEKTVELQKRIAIPFSVIPFALLGLVLGTVTRKGGRAYGFLFSFILVVGYYLMLTVWASACLGRGDSTLDRRLGGGYPTVRTGNPPLRPWRTRRMGTECLDRMECRASRKQA